MEISDASPIILDSSVWIAFFRQDDSLREKAKRTLSGLRGMTIVVPEYVLVEVATALKRKGYEEAAKKFVAEVMKDGQHTFLPAGEHMAGSTAELFLTRQRDGLSFTDTTLLLLSEKYQIVTFDRGLLKAIKNARTR